MCADATSQLHTLFQSVEKWWCGLLNGRDIAFAEAPIARQRYRLRFYT
jgi:hypothetical protein